MATKKIESLSSKKFDSKNLGKVLGGVPTYGPYYGTINGKYYPGGTDDEARHTYNPDGYPAGTEGDGDDFAWCI
ncbi:hypothetical protein [Fluviicola chungangensis]|uniref:Uncharacterized protein n=1 Tax=Fluviicola chungangensis TaxID=2597671 RepID=A0A556MMI2_9FLAO|nr:hypothetical protein [Fluviicola chungangensis]TSJ41154.1 hypothetical protein FO442_14675 [Fluviicola chungangensis]